jgi:hypothetical protein
VNSGPRFVWLVLAVAPRVALASDPQPEADRGWRWAAEVDPVPFFERGFSVHAAVKPGFARQLRLTLGGFGTTRSAAAGSTNDGWTAAQRALEVSGQYFPFDPDGRGWFAGVYVFLQRWSYTRDDASGEATGYWVTPAPAVGFQWLPWGHGLYVTPWAALGVPLRSGERRLADHVYEEPALFPVLALHIGYELGR